MNLEQVISLFESKHTAALSDRHAQTIILLCKQMLSEQKKGFYYKELNKVARVIELINQSLCNNKVSYPLLFLILTNIVRSDPRPNTFA